MLLTKSPVRFARMAIAVARQQLPRYRTRFSRRDYEWPQLVACLLVRQFLRLDYRGTEQVLREFTALRRALGLRCTPDHTALCRALRNLTLPQLERLLDETVARMVRLRCGPGRPPQHATVIPDSTGLRFDCTSRSYWHRIKRHGRFHRWPKWSIAADRKTHMILSQVADIGPRSDHCEFAALVDEAQRRRPSTELLADAGYDSHHNLRWCQEHHGLTAIIKVKKVGRPGPQGVEGSPITSPLRRRLFDRLPRRRYGQRWQVESAFSAHKRRFGDRIHSRTQARRRREQLLRGVLHNCAVLHPSRRA